MIPSTQQWTGAALTRSGPGRVPDGPFAHGIKARAQWKADRIAEQRAVACGVLEREDRALQQIDAPKGFWPFLGPANWHYRW